MQRTSFDLGWEYTADAGLYPLFNAEWTPVNLPHDASISRPRSAAHTTGGSGGYAWSGLVRYRKVFHVPEDWRSRSVQLEFEGVYMNAEVSVNRDLVALHPYGYTSFAVDLTPWLVYGADNTVTVAVNNSAQPNSRWYTGTGIYRHVWLVTGGATHIEPYGVYVRTLHGESGQATVAISTELAGPASAHAVVRLGIRDRDGQLMANSELPVKLGKEGAVTLEEALTFPAPRQWCLEDPYLYTLTSEVLVGGHVTDTASTRFGVRSISVDAEYGFRLNGRPLKLKGGCVHHDNGLLGAASYDRAEERKVELMKAAGYNAIRCAHNPPAPAMLDACDRLGMLVIDETFDCWRTAKQPNDYHLFFEDWWERDTASMVLRDRNHPSVIMWSIGNEVPERAGISDGAAWARRQADLVRSLDETRPVTSALPFLFEQVFNDPAPDGGSVTDAQSMFDPSRLVPASAASDRWGNLTREFCEALDVVGYNYLYPRYAWDAELFPGRVIAGTETFPSMAYATWSATEDHPQVIGDFVWTSIDYLGESGIGKVSTEPGMGFGTSYPYHLANCGDMDICGIKRPQSYYRDVLWGVRAVPYIGALDPAHHATGVYYNPWGWEPVSDCWSFPGQEGQPTTVDVYSADDEVELFQNGRSLGRKPAGAEVQNLARFDVVYEPGVIEAVGYRGGGETGKARLETAGKAVSLRLEADRPRLRAEYGDLAYITVTLIDEGGRRVPWATDLVQVTSSGAGEIIALGTADPLCEDLYTARQRTSYQGRLVAVVRASGQPGLILFDAASAGLKSVGLSIEVA
jgi:beta-galactosidase